jgi:hypothetical protein
MSDEFGPADAGQQVRSGRRRVVVAVVVGVALVVAVGGFFVARALWWSLQPTPEFPSLVAEPDESLVGTVAFIRPFPEDDCVWIVAAAGGEPEKVACIDGGAGGLEWRLDGRLQSTRYKGGEGTSDTGSWIIDPATGEVETVPRDEIPPQAEPPTVVGPGREQVETVSERGRLTMTMTAGGETRTLLSVAAPDTYTFGQPAWSPDGEWFVVKDDLDRLLSVTTADDSTTRVLVEGGFGQAITSEQLLGNAGP